MPRTSARDLSCQLIQHGCSLSDLLLEITLISVMRYYCGERSYRDTGIIVQASLCGGASVQKSETSNRSTGNENRSGALITGRSRRRSVAPVTFLRTPFVRPPPTIRSSRKVHRSARLFAARETASNQRRFGAPDTMRRGAARGVGRRLITLKFVDNGGNWRASCVA